MIDSSIYEAAAQVGATDDAKRSIADLADEMLGLEQQIEALQEQVAELQAKYDRIEQKDLPDAMRAVGMKQFALLDGRKVEINKVYTAASISEPISEQTVKKMTPAEIGEALARARQCFAYLRSSGHGSLIKRDIGLQFGMGQDNAAQEFAERCRAFLQEVGGGKMNDKTAVHPGTLNAFVKEQITSGLDLPDFFKVHTVDVAKVKAPTKAKPRSRGESGSSGRQEMI